MLSFIGKKTKGRKVGPHPGPWTLHLSQHRNPIFNKGFPSRNATYSFLGTASPVTYCRNSHFTFDLLEDFTARVCLVKPATSSTLPSVGSCLFTCELLWAGAKRLKGVLIKMRWIWVLLSLAVHEYSTYSFWAHSIITLPQPLWSLAWFFANKTWSKATHVTSY